MSLYFYKTFRLALTLLHNYIYNNISLLFQVTSWSQCITPTWYNYKSELLWRWERLYIYKHDKSKRLEKPLTLIKMVLKAFFQKRSLVLQTVKLNLTLLITEYFGVLYLSSHKYKPYNMYKNISIQIKTCVVCHKDKLLGLRQTRGQFTVISCKHLVPCHPRLNHSTTCYIYTSNKNWGCWIIE